MPLSDALQSLANGLGCQAAAISRQLGNEERPRTVAIFDKESKSDLPIIGRAFAADVMGHFYTKARPSTIWFLSDHMEDSDWTGTQTLSNWRLSRKVEEIVVLALAVNQRQSDYIEFHFTRALELSERLELEALVPTIERSWSGRKSGLVTQTRMDERLVRARSAAQAGKLKWDAPILGMSNPAGLSRSEFRVCLMLSRGLSVQGITDELGLSEATVRSHLRSIYSKTESSGQSELLYRILSSGKDAAEVATGSL
ncbi:MAG: helix-turn-helix transcriptional regulator [Silicimonas sp.]|nr:helix-turn-helix transcriptional regulator [Silicimonas sp.]